MLLPSLHHDNSHSFGFCDNSWLRAPSSPVCWDGITLIPCHYASDAVAIRVTGRLPLCWLQWQLRGSVLRDHRSAGRARPRNRGEGRRGALSPLSSVGTVTPGVCSVQCAICLVHWSVLTMWCVMVLLKGHSTVSSVHSFL